MRHMTRGSWWSSAILRTCLIYRFIFGLSTPVTLTLSATTLIWGHRGWEVPQVELESTVDEAGTWFYYPQIRLRSAGGGSRKGIAHRGNRLEYANWWNQYGILWMHLESVSAVANARKLAKPGVTVFLEGPRR